MIETIFEISKKLEENNIDYFLTCGTSLFLRKIIKKTKDIDFCIKEEDKKKIKKIFGKELIFTIKKKAITFDKNGYEIEFLLINEKNDPISFKIFEKKDYEIIKRNKKEIKIISIKDLISMYRFVYLRDGKEKYLERIKLLENLK